MVLNALKKAKKAISLTNVITLANSLAKTFGLNFMI